MSLIVSFAADFWTFLPLAVLADAFSYAFVSRFFSGNYLALGDFFAGDFFAGDYLAELFFATAVFDADLALTRSLLLS